MRIITENWRHYLNEERSRQITEEQVKEIFAEHGYILSEDLLQEIDWKKAKRLLNQGIVGLALIGALTGIARPVMANPVGGECSADECAVELAPETEEMKKELAELVEAIIGNKKPSPEELEEIYKMVGWNVAEWGSHLDYLVAPPPAR